MISPNEPIAIVGTGCRFPGQSNTSAKLWELLSQPRELSIPIPPSRFNSNGFYHPDGFHHGTSNVQKSYFLSEDVRKFDSQFFNISTAEAESMDPQQRQLLEVVFEAMESANLTLEEMRGTPTAVYVGLMCDDYSGLIFADMETLPTYGATGAARSILSNRISYFFDWTGPSMTIDSACSSSLVAVHQAVQTLRNGECRVALAAGANLILSARMFVAESKLKMLSPNGRSRMWDADGDGYARGEGIAAVMLKRLSDAIADGDHIECIIRETSVNQGGRSTGLTVPNPVAQVNLIRQTYAKAGLDLDRSEDRPQYFQAHGTGTKVGDLNEATAIHNTFFSKPEDQNKEKLFIGSIKTIIGHSEGAAGIAGMLEACLAVKHGIIPPNLHFETLNPKLEPFIHRLEVPTTAQQWPAHSGDVRRASVNSFGFGGTNAHVILENAPEQVRPASPAASSSLIALPLAFSAASEKSLGSLLFNYSQFLSNNPDTDLNTLAWTLLSKRSVFTHKVSFTARTVSELRSKLDDELEHRANGTPKAISSRPSTKLKRILGVFTGQGAQWAAMGWDLIFASSVGKETLQKLEDSLASLPTDHRPDWSLTTELSAAATTSRVAEAIISQPLCTAIQIILVDHLRAAGVSFSGVVGHSSGEIGAAYAAGFFSADAAIKIAYYRGFFAKLAGAGKLGSMIAVGISRAEAIEFCQLPEFNGRIVVAASNSSSSVTLSGDADAVDEAKDYFEGKEIFARILKVDTAYHSHHMQPCSEPYLQALKDCNIELLPQPDDGCVWYSSVNEGQTMDAQDLLLGPYWMDNMLNTVLFSQALTASIASGSYDFAIEVGPHPALKGPALQTLKESTGSKKDVPYVGLLGRGKTGIETFSDALGSLWMHFGAKAFNVASYDQIFHEVPSCSPLQGLPTYPWDHERTLWYESRGSRETRSRADSPHELLGIVTSDQAEGEYKWRNYLKLNEIPWLSGHQIQGQTIFPAAGYLVMALEASRSVARDKEVRLIEIQDFKILQAISINDDGSGVETLFSITNIVSDPKHSVLNADFICHACLSRDTGSLVLVSLGKLTLHFGAHSASILPSRSLAVINDLREVNIETFYDSLGDVGYGYTGPFRGISFLEQKLDTSTGLIIDSNSTISNHSMMMHPGTLDSAIQTLFACLGTPGDGSLWTLHVPVTIRNIRVNPAICASTDAKKPRHEVMFDAALAESVSDTLCGDVTLYDIETRNAICQIEGIEVKPLMPATAADDRHLFHELVWATAEPDAALVYRKTKFSPSEIQKAETLETICLYYLKQLVDSVSTAEKEETSWHGKRILAFANHVVDETRAGRHASCKTKWLDNTWEDVQAVAGQYAADVDCKLLHVVGTKLIPFIRGETSILEHMRQDSLLDLYYQNSELLEYNLYAGLIAEQIAFRYPLIKILEIGGGTGGITRSILKHIDNKYSSYTFTDISVGFFEEAQETFKGHGRIIYEALDIERDPTTQGFTENSYDLVIASNVLHATKVLDNTMKNVRKLLKPGGKLLVLEAVDNGATRVGFSFCGVPGWWAGADDGRELGPLITPEQWDSLLLRNGFSGLDTVTPGTESVYQPVAVFISTAIDEEIQLLQKPLASSGPKPQLDSMFIVGGKTDTTRQLAADLAVILEPWSKEIRTLESLEDVHKLEDFSMVHVLNLAELDAPIFEDLTSDRLESFKSLLNISKSFLWVTAGSKSERPYSNMALGIGRTLVHEMPHLRLQVLDTAHVDELSASLLAEAFLRIVLAETWENDIYAPKRMWSNEPELWLENGRLHITRVVPEKAANNRLMSSRRIIEEDANVDEGVVELIHSGNSYELQCSLSNFAPATGDLASIRVTHSTLMALKIYSTGFIYLILGQMPGVGTKVIALSESLGSTISTPACWTLPWYVADGDEASLLTAIASEIVAQSIIDMTKKNSTLLLFEPELSLAAAISRKSRYNGINPQFITTQNSLEKSDWLQLQQFSSGREIRSRLPRNVSAFVDFSDSSDLAQRIGASVPFYCQRGSWSTLLSHNSNYPGSASLNLVADTLSIALANSMSVLRSTRPAVSPTIINAAELPHTTTSTLGLQIVDWSAASKLPARIQSAESMMRFKDDKTYLLIGMAGNLGRSLCRWMILHGAKHIVLTSRNPKIEQSWLDEMGSLGGAVKIMAMDVTNKDSLLATHEQIISTLPPIAGVANAAMVLSDTLLSNMSFKEMKTVISPKVDGSRFLDEIFPHNDLDFFILFGSAVDVMGNSGQAAYCAANMFMNSLVSSRQKRGLAGSLIGLGEVKGVGYAARMNRELNDIIGATLPLSEKEVHHMFAEGVLAGQPSSGRNPVLYAGMDSKDPRKDPDILWYPHPKFWHYIESGDGAAATETKGATVSLKSQLAVAASMDDVVNIVTDAFTLKLRHKLQVSSETAVPSDSVLLELGIDSLVAVDLRAWFVTELGVDMPILKILGGATIIDLVTDAVARLPATLLPAIVAELKEEEAKATQAVLVPNGLGGHDLIAINPAPETSVAASESPESVSEIETTKSHEKGHSKNISFASTSSGHSSSETDAFSQPHSPALSDTSSLPDNEEVVQLIKSTLDIDTNDTSVCDNRKIDVDIGGDGETASPSSPDEQVLTPKSDGIDGSGVLLLNGGEIGQVIEIAPL